MVEATEDRWSLWGLAQAIALLVVAVPVLILLVLYGLSVLLEVHYGDLVLVLSFLVAVMWVIQGGSDFIQRPGALDEDDPFVERAADVSPGEHLRGEGVIDRPILYSLTATMLLGWATVLVLG